EIDQSKYTIRVYRGDEAQSADSLITSKEGGEDAAPPYRGTAYVVFDNMPVAAFGNRLPQLNFEVFRAVDDFEARVRAVTLIPSAGEFVYEPDRVIRIENGKTIAENLHTGLGGTDWKVSLDQLEEQLPNAGNVSLVVSWFGTDLRIGHCEIRPGVEVDDKDTQPDTWSVGGIAREAAYVVSQVNDRPAYGGTPSDQAVISAIQDLKARGFSVTFYPFISMDVPDGNGLPDPYSGASGQPAYPWRCRITCTPAPGQPGSVDKTGACATQVAAFAGEAAPGDFTVLGETVVYSGPPEWSFRRFILHYAHLCAAAGGVDAFLIGSEMRGASTLRSSASTFPFVDALVDLAEDVSSVLGPTTKI
ncbi:MAG: baseplate megatron protein TIM-barrel domain-containing protein, partial [Bradyrhizobium sp.]